MSVQPRSSAINYLPKEMYVEIFLQIESPLDLFKILKVCKIWKNILDENKLIWQRHIHNSLNAIYLDPRSSLKIILKINLNVRPHSQTRLKKITAFNLGGGRVEQAQKTITLPNSSYKNQRRSDK